MNGGQGLVVSKEESCQQSSHCCNWFKLMGNYPFIEKDALPSPTPTVWSYILPCTGVRDYVACSDHLCS